MPAHRTLGRPLLTEQEHLLEGIVGARGSFAPRRGPVTTDIKCTDGAVWVIDYDEQSPYHAFAGRRVVAWGSPCAPPMQHRIGVTGHFAVSTMQLAEVASDAWLIEVRAPQDLVGRFEHGGAGAGAESELFFVTEDGDAFRVANNPAGAAIGGLVNALVYPVQLSRSVSSPQQALWIICPWSYAKLNELRDGPNGGLPSDVYMDAASGQVRCRSGLLARNVSDFRGSDDNPVQTTYHISPNAPSLMSWDAYESRATTEWQALLNSSEGCDERKVHHFLAKHPSFVPGVFGMTERRVPSCALLLGPFF